MKKIFTCLLSLAACFCALNAVCAAAVPAGAGPVGYQENAGPQVTAQSAVLMDALTGQILYSRAADVRRYPASTTKIMTLIVALEHGNSDDIVTVSPQAAGVEGSTIWLEAGEQIRLEDLLYGMMLVSGNDATVAVAERIAGSVDAFAQMMTAKAHEIGAVHTNFVNSSGLPDDNHYTTARDLALITAYGYKNPTFAKIVGSKEWPLFRTRGPQYRKLENENILLWIYPGGNGVKTGYTEVAGRCLVSAANRDGIQLIAVVLDSLFMWNDSIALLNYGFQTLQPQQLVTAGQIEASVPVLGGRSRSLPVKAEQSLTVPVGGSGADKYSVTMELPDHVQAAVHADDPIGTLEILYDGQEVASTKLLAAKSIEKKSFFSYLYQQWCSVIAFL